MRPTETNLKNCEIHLSRMSERHSGMISKKYMVADLQKLPASDESF